MTGPSVPGAFCLVLHSHLPWLPGHGVWPLGEEWLHQAWGESYVPLVQALDSLAAQGHRDVLTLGVTPVLAAQLDHPAMLADVRRWAGLWELRCRELASSRDTNAHWQRIAAHELDIARSVSASLATRWAGGGSPVLRSLHDGGVIELLGGPAAHPFLPLLEPEVAATALAAGLADGRSRLGTAPRGIWSPECGFAPHLGPVLADAGVTHVLVDEETVTSSGGHPHLPWTVAGTGVVALARDLEVTNLIWSSSTGYPAGPQYRDFHARERYTGLRLHAITGGDGVKEPYSPEEAATQVAADVEHFVAAVAARLRHVEARQGRPGVVVAAYDTELFGHWWHEGPAFLEAVIPALREAGVDVTTLAGAIERVGTGGPLALREGSWGAGKDFSVWAGAAVEDLAAENRWVQRRWLDLVARERSSGSLRVRRPDLDQLATTMFHALSSDWAFLVTRGQSVDYARRRATEHRTAFHDLAHLIAVGDAVGATAEAARQAAVDGAFPALDIRRVLP